MFKLIIITFFTLTTVFANNQNLNIDLTVEEKTWLSNNPKITMVIPNNFPRSYLNEDGKMEGMDIDYFNLIEKKLGIKFDKRIMPWHKALKKAMNHEVDVIINAGKIKNREPYLNFTKTYFSIPQAVVSHDTEADISDLNEFCEKTLAVNKGSSKARYLKKNYPCIKLHLVTNKAELVSSIITNKADGGFGNFDSLSGNIKKMLLPNLKFIYFKYMPPMGYARVGVRKDKPILASIIDKAISAISLEEKNKIVSKHLNVQLPPVPNKEIDKSKLNLTKKEKDFIEKQNIIKYVYDAHKEPFEYKNDLDIHTGMTADLLNIISKKTDLKFTPIYTSSWSEVLNILQKRQADFTSFITQNKEKEEFLNFTNKNLFKVPVVFATQKDDETIYGDIKYDFVDKKIGVLKNSQIHTKLINKYPKLNFIEVNSLKEGMQDVVDGKLDMLTINKSTVNYYIKHKGFDTLKIATSIDMYYEFKMAVIKNAPDELISILNKAIDTITDEQFNNIYKKYVNISIENTTNWKIIGTIIFIFVLIILIFILLNRRLKNLINEKTHELKILNENLEIKVEIRTSELQQINKKVRDSIQFASLIQHAILPQQEILDNYTTDNFAKWQPKDIVGGDIYFVVELESKEEVLIMVIDGAGHGVPGAFVTMLVKAIETQIVARIKEGVLNPSPAEILEYFNISIKTMLKQEKGSKSNAGFDGGIIYYNKTTKICKYAGAKTDLYIIDDNKLDIISGDKKNVGFVRTKIDQQYTEHTVSLNKDTKLYLSTDGVFDQEGENKTRYGLDKFEEFLVEINNEPFEKQSMLIMKSFNDFKKEINQTDDVTVVGLNFR